MTNKMTGSLFAFGMDTESAWMQAKECAALRDLLTRADCHGGEDDVFFLCLKKKNILARIKSDEKTSHPYLLGMAFDAAERSVWYYLPEWTAVLLNIFQSSDYLPYFSSEKSFTWDLNGEETGRLLRKAEQTQRELMQAIATCVQENAETLEPHSVAFCGINPARYETAGIVYYPYAHRECVKTLPISARRTKETALYLKPPKVFRAWTLTDKQDKIKISNIRESQSWNNLYQRIQTEWNADLLEQEE